MAPSVPISLTRDLDRLTSTTFDLLVIGGGIYGVTIACDAAQRGLSVALIERNDFGSGTSFNHLRTIHGGLRYLQTLDLARARQSIVERRTLAQIAPWAVRPMPFVLPLQRSLTRGRTAMAAAMLLDRVIAADRNHGVPPSHRLPSGRILGRDRALRAYPSLQRMPLRAAAVWYDYVTTDADRLTLAWALSAVQHGAVVANYLEALSLKADGGRVLGAAARDQVTGEALLIRALTVANATGAAVNRLLAPFGGVELPLLRAMNVVTTRPALEAAFGGRGRSGGTLFAVPWNGRTLIGTWQSTHICQSDDLAVPDSELDAFLQEANAIFPAADLTRDDVTLVHRGIVPAVLRHGGSPALQGGDVVFEHEATGLAGLVSVAGTKYTTARSVGMRIVDRLFKYLDRPRVGSRSASIVLPHVALSGDALLQHAARHEMVLTLADAVMRRTPLGSTGCPKEETLCHAAAVVGNVLGWSVERRRDEIEAVRQLY
jgi:glycerol-3-phosphate dehydrogenase